MCILLCTVFCTAAAQDQERITEHFEWGEYDSLIEILNSHLDTVKEVSDSALTARYFSYLGVAQFSKGMFDKARECFYSALLYDQSVNIDSVYITPEMQNLFITTKKEFNKQMNRFKYQDSLLIAKQYAFEENFNRIRSDALRKKRKNLSIFSSVLSGIGVLFVGGVFYEYFTTKDLYHQFRISANSGDMIQYNRYRSIVKQANSIAIGFEVSAAACLSSGLIIGIRSIKFKHNLINNR